MSCIHSNLPNSVAAYSSFQSDQERNKEIWTRYSSPSLESTPTHPFVVPMVFNVNEKNPGKLFCCGELHGNKRCLREQAELIAYLASKAPVLLVFEGFPSLEKIDNVFEAGGFHAFDFEIVNPGDHNAIANCKIIKDYDSVCHPFLDPSLQNVGNRIHGVGWDNNKEYLEKKEELFIELEEIPWRRLSLLEDRINQAKKISEKLPDRLKLLPFKKLEPTYDLSTNDVSDVNFILDVFLEKVRNSTRFYINGNEYCADLLNSYCIDLLDEDSFYCYSVDLGNDDFVYLGDDYSSYEEFEFRAEQLSRELDEQEIELERLLTDSVKTDFPSRTASMIKTLQGIKEYRLLHKIEEGYTVLIAGNAHLGIAEPGIEYDLSSFYEELREHHEAVILFSEPAYKDLEDFREKMGLTGKVYERF